MTAPVKRVGAGVTLGWDSTGGSSWVVLGNIVGGFSGDAKAKFADSSLLSDIWDTKLKTSVDPGQIETMIAYDPSDSDYHNLATSLAQINSAPPNWQVTFPQASATDTSGTKTESFFAYVGGLGREVKRDGFCTAKLTLDITGNAGFATS